MIRLVRNEIGQIFIIKGHRKKVLMEIEGTGDIYSNVREGMIELISKFSKYGTLVKRLREDYEGPQGILDPLDVNPSDLEPYANHLKLDVPKLERFRQEVREAGFYVFRIVTVKGARTYIVIK